MAAESRAIESLQSPAVIGFVKAHVKYELYMAEICEKDIFSNLPERPGQGRGVNIHQIDHDGTPGQVRDSANPRTARSSA